MNWVRLVTDLTDVYTIPFITGYTCVSGSTISRLKSGSIKDPKYSVGARLVTLWLKANCGDLSDVQLGGD